MPIRHILLPQEVDFFYFYDLGHNILLPECQMSDCQNGFFYAKPGHPILKQAISLIVENCKRKDKGLTPLTLSGPGLFGKVIANFVPSRNIMHGHFMPLTPTTGAKTWPMSPPQASSWPGTNQHGSPKKKRQSPAGKALELRVETTIFNSGKTTKSFYKPST